MSRRRISFPFPAPRMPSHAVICQAVTAASTTADRSGESRSDLDQLTAISSSALEQLDIERGVCIPFRKYTAEAVRSKVLESRGAIWSLVIGGVEIVWNFWDFTGPLLCTTAWSGGTRKFVPFCAMQLRNLLCDLGPSFIEAGQVHANRPDIIRVDYMNELCILQDDVPPFPNQAIKDAGIDVNGFLTVGVSAALRQLLEFALFHGDPHPGNIFAMRDGRIAYVDFGNVDEWI